MLADLIASTDSTTLLILFVALATALAFEFVNGFHDTANAVATVIYTQSMRATPAVVLSGFCNFLGVQLGGIAVAYSIVHLLPVDLLVGGSTGGSLAMVFAMLIAALLWNLGTWYYGLPASSSHTLIGAILGVGLANAALQGLPLADSVNWNKAGEVGMGLLISPLIGFGGAALLLWGMKRTMPGDLHEPPKGDRPPPLWIRSMLIASCAGVSFTHGSNDGQKGVGLIMLILIGLLPTVYAVNLSLDRDHIQRVEAAAIALEGYFATNQQRLAASMTPDRIAAIRKRDADQKDKLYFVECGLDKAKDAAKVVQIEIANHTSLTSVGEKDRWLLRANLLCLDDAVSNAIALAPHPGEAAQLKAWQADLRMVTEHAPEWVLLAVSLALGIGTMVGYKRIVVTIGEKIGKTRLTYAQGAAAQMVAIGTIYGAGNLGLPVSTTHVLSSGVAGTMAVAGSGLQAGTLKAILLAWVTTLPASMALSGGLYVILRLVIA